MIAERRKVLTMLHEHRINVDEAEGLLDALEQAPEPAPEVKVEYVTADPKVQEILDHAQKAAASSAPVLIVGESGTGKELVARMIHVNSPRREKPFLALNCASVPESLIGSELFGHERGAFTGAVRSKMGALERVDGGTLFFDEISALPMDVQAKLLRFAQDGEFERIAGIKTIRADVRLVAATNRDLQAEAQAGRFRQDLFYGLSVVLLEIPPLRERAEDIPLLVDYFVKKYAMQYDRSAPTIAPQAIDALTAYHWPGNVRELSRAIQSAVVMSRHGEAIRVEDLPDALTKE
jgi:DNA-binding NtrC family response regulator